MALRDALTQSQRDALPVTSFALPETRAYPYRGISEDPAEDRHHAALSLARAFHFEDDETSGKVLAAVQAEYPELSCRRNGESVVVIDALGKVGATLSDATRSIGFKVYRKGE
jgi:hypothetical protein